MNSNFAAFLRLIGRVEAGGGQQQRHIRIIRPGSFREKDYSPSTETEYRYISLGYVTCWTPLDGVDLLLVSLKVVDARILVHRPDLEYIYIFFIFS
jgi:hypothetical protein